MRGTRAKKIRKSMKYLNPPGEKRMANGQVVNPRRMEYQKAKKAARGL